MKKKMKKKRNTDIAEPVFDAGKTWYLLPLYLSDRFTGWMEPGKIIVESDLMRFGKMKSRIRIADSVNICRELSDFLIFPVKIEKDTHLEIEKENGYFWFASKVELLEPVEYWKLIPQKCDEFEGTICIYHKYFMPEGLVLPKKLKGDLQFTECTFPYEITLPSVIEGHLNIMNCEIPSLTALQFPLNKDCKIMIAQDSDTTDLIVPEELRNRITFVDTGYVEHHSEEAEDDLSKACFLMPLDPADEFSEDLDWGNMEPPMNIMLYDPIAFFRWNCTNSGSRLIITDFQGLCSHLSSPYYFKVSVDRTARVERIDQHSWYAERVKLRMRYSLPELFKTFSHNIHEGTIDFTGLASIPEKLILPAVIDGDLIFNYNYLPDRIKLPQKISGELRIEKCDIPFTWKFPKELDKLYLNSCNTDDNNGKLPLKILLSVKHINEIKFIRCDLPDNFFIPFAYLNALLFLDMTVPKGLKLTENFPGTLEFKNASIPEGLILPETIKGGLLFSNCLLPLTIVLPKTIEGYFAISECAIPHSWKTILPKEVDNLILSNLVLNSGTVLSEKVNKKVFFHELTAFEGGVIMPLTYQSIHANFTDFPSDFKLIQSDIEKVSFENCILPVSFQIPDASSIELSMGDTKNHIDLRLPENFVGTLSFCASKIASGVKLPKQFEGYMDFYNLKFPARLELPVSFNGLLRFGLTTLPTGLKLPENFTGELSFSDMILPPDLKFPKEFHGKLEFSEVSVPEGFEMPDKLIGMLKIVDSKINGRLQLP